MNNATVRMTWSVRGERIAQTTEPSTDRINAGQKSALSRGALPSGDCERTVRGQTKTQIVFHLNFAATANLAALEDFYDPAPLPKSWR